MVECLIITGATATGKTDVAIDVARRIDGEIISADSRQIYRGMDVGTAKANAEQRARVPHYGIDLLPPTDRFSAGKFAEAARGWIREIQGRGHVPIVAGGTGFFLRSLTHPMFAEPEMDSGRREALKRLLNTRTREELLDWLKTLDRAGADSLPPESGRQRIARMIEIVLLTGRPLRWWHEQSGPPAPPLRAVTFVLELPREILYERINRRVRDMIDHGLVQEVQKLLANGNEGSPAMKTVGYAELVPYLRGEYGLEEAITLIQRATRAYARRQITWFRHQLAEPVIRIDAEDPRDSMVDTIVTEWQKYHAHRN